MEIEKFRNDLDAVIPRIKQGVASESALSHSSLSKALLDLLPKLGRELDEATRKAREHIGNVVKRHIHDVPDSPLLNSVSVFQAMGFCRFETSHTRALAWLLDARQPHGFSDVLLKAFLEKINCGDDQEWVNSHRLIARQTTSYSVRTEWPVPGAGRLDIFVKSDSNAEAWSLVIEAKIDAFERAAQLEDYARDLSANSLCVLLTPQGRKGKSIGKSRAWAVTSFLGMASGFLNAWPSLRDKPGAPFLKLYLSGLLQDVCGIWCCPTAEKILATNDPYDLYQLLGVEHEK